MKSLTVHFAIKDDESFSDMRNKIFENFNLESLDKNGWAATNISIEDEMKRLENIERLCERLSGSEILFQIKIALTTEVSEYDVEAVIAEYGE